MADPKKKIRPAKKEAVKKTLKKAVSKTAKKPLKKKQPAKKSEVFKKFPRNPIIAPRDENHWEAWQTFNPGAVAAGGRIHFVYRAIGRDGLSRFGYAFSDDGFAVGGRPENHVFEHPIIGADGYFYYGSGGSFGGCEDPRLTEISEDGRIYLTYTACEGGLRVGLTSIRTEDFLAKDWQWKKPALISKPGEHHKNWVVFPERIGGKYAILHSLNPKVAVAYLDNLDFKEGEFIESFYGGPERKKSWDTVVRGIGAPPLKTKEGWLIFYHAIDAKDPGKYKVGAMLLNLENPEKILYRSARPVLEPAEHYENIGFKSGVVYVSGAVIRNGRLIIYYGGADNYVCAASADLEEFLAELKKGGRLPLKKTAGRKKK